MARERPDLKRYAGRKLTVIAWRWARTVKSPNPVFRDVDAPLASTFMLSIKKGKEAHVEPVIEDGGYPFTVKAGRPEARISAAGIPETSASEAEADILKHGAPGNACVPPRIDRRRPRRPICGRDTGVPRTPFPRKRLRGVKSASNPPNRS